MGHIIGEYGRCEGQIGCVDVVRILLLDCLRQLFCGGSLLYFQGLHTSDMDALSLIMPFSTFIFFKKFYIPFSTLIIKEIERGICVVISTSSIVGKKLIQNLFDKESCRFIVNLIQLFGLMPNGLWHEVRYYAFYQILCLALARCYSFYF